MKVLLALSLLLFLNSVFSQGDVIDCSASGRCPKRFTERDNSCSLALVQCKRYGNIACTSLEPSCSPEEIINACNNDSSYYSATCDRINQKIRKEKYAKTQKQCENLKNDCIKRGGDSCPSAAEVCDPDTTVQLCKGGEIHSTDICEKAEIEQEKARAENTKYSCDNAQKLCLANKFINACSPIFKLCDVQTAAKWCYKDRTNPIEKISDADCSRVVKKSQDLMFGKSNEECWKQVPLCEGGDSEACMKVPTFCVKEVVSALCNAKKIKNKRVCTFAGSDKTTSPSHPGCDFFGDRCVYDEGQYCSLVTRYCDNHTIDFLCGELKITDKSICERARSGLAISLPNIFGL